MTADYLRENVPEVAHAIDSGGCFYSVAEEPWLSRSGENSGFAALMPSAHRASAGVPGERFYRRRERDAFRLD